MENTSTQPTPESTPAEPASISLQDLMALQNVLDIACQRGAFRGNEMKAVGELYNKLAIFLESVKPLAPGAETETETPNT
jgi:hypothetical protein